MPNEPEQTPENKFAPTARRNARRYALQALYQWQLAGAEMQTIEAEFLHRHIDKPLDMQYFKELIHGVMDQQDSLDKEIQLYLGRHFNEIDPVELAVLRLSTYELLHRIDVPYRVVINEALELTKKFGSIEGHKFVNGVLDRIARKHRQLEMKK